LGGYLLLSNALITFINLTLALETKMGQATNVLDAFDVEVFIFQSNLQIEVVKVIKPFLQFLKVYD
jgi:hypothetical protein